MQGAWKGTRQAYLQPTTLWKVSSLLFERKTAFKDTTIATVGTLDNLNRIEVFLNEAEFQTQKNKGKGSGGAKGKGGSDAREVGEGGRGPVATPATNLSSAPPLVR